MQAIPRYTWLALNLPAASPERAKALTEIERSTGLLTDSLKSFEKFNLSPEARAKIAELNGQLPHFLEVAKTGHDLLAQNDETGNREARSILLTKLPPVAIGTTSLVKDTNEIIKARNQAIVSEAVASAENAQRALTLTSIVMSLAALIAGFAFALRLSRQLLQITDAVGDASSQVATASAQLSNAADLLS